ncbi:MAG: hypothetical protein ABEJ22_07935 [Haloferacaceae archaeon]
MADALVGVVALVHGVVLLTPTAARLGNASGPLMVGYAAVMLLLQAWAATGMRMSGMDGGGMDGGMDGTGGMGDVSGTMAMHWDAGMVALALLMLASGVLMLVRREEMSASQRGASDARSVDRKSS